MILCPPSQVLLFLHFAPFSASPSTHLDDHSGSLSRRGVSHLWETLLSTTREIFSDADGPDSSLKRDVRDQAWNNGLEGGSTARNRRSSWWSEGLCVTHTRAFVPRFPYFRRPSLLSRFLFFNPPNPRASSRAGWGSTGNGKAMYDWLVNHGSTDDAATQELLLPDVRPAFHTFQVWRCVILGVGGLEERSCSPTSVVGVFNKLAAVNLFDNGVFERPEGILTDNGLFNMMQNSGRCAVLQSHLPTLNLNGGSSAAGEELEIGNEDKPDAKANSTGNDRNRVLIKSPTYLRYPPGLGFSASCSSDSGTPIGKASVDISGDLLGTASLQPHSSTSSTPPLLQIPPKCPKPIPTAGWRGERTPASSGGGAEDFDEQPPAPCGSEPNATFRNYMARLYITSTSLFRFSHTTSMEHPAKNSDHCRSGLDAAVWGGERGWPHLGGRTETGAFQGRNASLMWGGSSGCMSAWHDSDASTLDELSVSSGGVTQPCSCVNSGGCL